MFTTIHFNMIFTCCLKINCNFNNIVCIIMCIIIVNKGKFMYKRVNLYFHDYFYQMLLDKIGKGNISKFIEEKMLIIMNDESK